MNNHILAVRRLKTKYFNNSDERNENEDLLDVQIDAGVVAETILALAEMQSKQEHETTLTIVAVVALFAGFAQQVVNIFGTVR